MQYGFGKHPIADEERHFGVLHFADYLSRGLLFIGHFGSIEAGEVVGGGGNLVSFAHPIKEWGFAQLSLGGIQIRAAEKVL
ncbi:MAG: hypothetical protein RLZZ512_1689 [Bacteroidota bacterium]